MKRHMRASLVALAALSLAGSPLAAQSARMGSPPAEMPRDGEKATQILATDAAARLGVSRAEAKENRAAAMQSEGQMVRWIVIGAVILLAVAVVLAIAN